MDQNIINNYLTFLQYTQRNYENTFKFVPLTETKQCFVKNHTLPEVGLWNSKDVDLPKTVTEFNKLSNNIHGIGIHTSPDIVVLDLDSTVTEDGTKVPLTEKQKDYLIAKLGTLAQRTKSGIHLFFNNDIDVKVATTNLNFNLGNSTIKYDIRGVSKAYVGIKPLKNSFTLNEMVNISKYQKIFNLEPKQENQKRSYLIADEKLASFFDDPTPEVYEQDEAKMYTIENVINGRTLKQLQEENYAEGNRYPTFTQIALRGAKHGVNYNVIQDIILKMNSNLAEALNNKRLDAVFKVTDELINNYAEYEHNRTKIKQNNLLPNLRMKVTEIKQLPYSKSVHGFSMYKDKSGTNKFTNYEILVDNLDPKIKKDDVIDCKLTECKFTTGYEENGQKIELKKSIYKGKSINAQLVTKETPYQMYGISTNGEITGQIKEDKFNKTVTLKNEDKFMKLSFDKDLNFEFKPGIKYNLPLTNFVTSANEEGKFFSNAKLSKFTVMNLNKFQNKEQVITINNNEIQNQEQQTFNQEVRFNQNIPIEHEFNPNITEPPIMAEPSYYDSMIPPNFENTNYEDIPSPQDINTQPMSEQNVNDNIRFNPQLPNLRMTVKKITKSKKCTFIEGFVARKKKSSNEYDFTNYNIGVYDLKSEVKYKDVIDIALTNLEYKPDFINKNGVKEKYNHSQFNGYGKNVIIVNKQTKNKMLGASICGVLTTKNNKLLIKENNKDSLLLNQKYYYPKFESKDLTLPITAFSVDWTNKTTKCNVNLELEKMLKFERSDKSKQIEVNPNLSMN